MVTNVFNGKIQFFPPVNKNNARISAITTLIQHSTRSLIKRGETRKRNEGIQNG